MATSNITAKLRDRRTSNNENNPNITIENREQLKEPEQDIFVSYPIDSREAENDQFSVSVHSSDSRMGGNDKGTHFFSLFETDFHTNLDDNNNDPTSQKYKHNDQYSMNAEESKSEDGNSQSDSQNGMLLFKLLSKEFQFPFHKFVDTLIEIYSLVQNIQFDCKLPAITNKSISILRMCSWFFVV